MSNVLFDGNMSSGNGTAGAGSSVSSTGIQAGADSNSTGLRIKSGYDRGGVVTNVQYSNSCYQDHKAEIVFSPNYEATTGTETPNLNNILMQNLTFLTAGTVQFTGTSNNGATVYPLQVTLDNVNIPQQLSGHHEFSPAPTNASLTLWPRPGLRPTSLSDYANLRWLEWQHGDEQHHGGQPASRRMQLHLHRAGADRSFGPAADSHSRARTRRRW